MWPHLQSVHHVTPGLSDVSINYLYCNKWLFTLAFGTGHDGADLCNQGLVTSIVISNAFILSTAMM